MTGFKNLLLAFTVLSASTAAFASDDNFASLTLGKTSDKVKKSHVLGYYAAYDNVSVSHNGIKLRQEDLMGRYDLSCHSQSPC